jgi:hypothetical protein
MNRKIIGLIIDDQFIPTFVQQVQSAPGIADTDPCVVRHFQGGIEVFMVADTKIQRILINFQ